MRIAIIGSGISGMGAALALSEAGHEITLFEKDLRPGGHAATVDIEHSGHKIAVDTGFIVYNTLNYPNFTPMLDWLGVATQASDAPSTAWIRLKPSRASQPEPGARLLQRDPSVS